MFVPNLTNFHQGAPEILLPPEWVGQMKRQMYKNKCYSKRETPQSKEHSAKVSTWYPNEDSDHLRAVYELHHESFTQQSYTNDISDCRVLKERTLNNNIFPYISIIGTNTEVYTFGKSYKQINAETILEKWICRSINNLSNSNSDHVTSACIKLPEKTDIHINVLWAK